MRSAYSASRTPTIRVGEHEVDVARLLIKLGVIRLGYPSEAALKLLSKMSSKYDGWPRTVAVYL